jgi:hypothetical protein
MEKQEIAVFSLRKSRSSAEKPDPSHQSCLHGQLQGKQQSQFGRAMPKRSQDKTSKK